MYGLQRERGVRRKEIRGKPEVLPPRKMNKKDRKKKVGKKKTTT